MLIFDYLFSYKHVFDITVEITILSKVDLLNFVVFIFLWYNLQGFLNLPCFSQVIVFFVVAYEEQLLRRWWFRYYWFLNWVVSFVVYLFVCRDRIFIVDLLHRHEKGFTLYLHFRQIHQTRPFLRVLFLKINFELWWLWRFGKLLHENTVALRV